MGRLSVVNRQLVRGAQGAQGLPGIGSAAWQPSTLYAVNSIVQAPDGSWLSADIEHTSGSTFDEQEALYWTVTEAKADTLARAQLAVLFADKATQDTVDLGRLNDAVLTGRFGDSSVYVGASQMVASGQGTPTNTPPLGNLVACWRLDGAGATDEGVVFTVELPKSWAKFDVWARGCNAGAGTGAVRLIGQWNNTVSDGEDVTSGASTGTAGVLTVGAQNIRQSVRLRTGLVNDSTTTHTLRVYRTPSHADDTLGNDWALTGIQFVATEYVQFEPEVPLPPEDLTTQAFTQADNASLAGLRVWHQTPPPVDNTDDEGFLSFPGTDYASRQNVTTSTWVGNKWAIIWADRCNYGDAQNKRPNPLVAPAVYVGTRECRAVYTTRAKAMAATRAKARHVLGMTSGEIEADWVTAGGVSGDIITDSTFRASPSTYCTTDFTYGGTTYKVMVDKVVLPPMQFSTAEHKGIFLDYEAQDTRTASDSTTHISDLASDCHGEGKEIMLYTNPLTGDLQPYNGLDGTNLPTILDAVDYLSVLLWSQAEEGSISASWTAQIALLGSLVTADWAKIAITFELGPESTGTTLADAEWVYDKCHEAGSDHPTNVVIWRNGAQLGGSLSRLTNQKLSTVCFGTPSPP